jgi:hypothetical protein
MKSMLTHLRDAYTPKRLVITMLLVSTVILSAAFVAEQMTSKAAAIPQTFNLRGTWKGQMSGSGSVLRTYPIKVDSTLNGTINGDNSAGSWVGHCRANYELTSIGEKDIGLGEVKGTYTMSVDKSGAITGEVTAKTSDVLVGELKLKLQGTVSESGSFKGTCSGTLTAITFGYGGTPVSADINLPVSGEFEGIAEVAGSTSTPTSTLAPTTSSPTLPAPGSQPTQTGDQYMMYVILTTVAAVAVVGFYIVKSKRTAQK